MLMLIPIQKHHSIVQSQSSGSNNRRQNRVLNMSAQVIYSFSRGMPWHETFNYMDITVIICVTLWHTSCKYIMKHVHNQLTDSLSVILDSPKCKKQFHLSDVLLSPANGLTRKQDSLIKAALFQFITDTQRKL